MSPMIASPYMVHVHIHWAVGALGCMGTWYGTWFSASSDVPKTIDRRFLASQGTRFSVWMPSCGQYTCQSTVQWPFRKCALFWVEVGGTLSDIDLLFWDLELGLGELPLYLTCFCNDHVLLQSVFLQLSSLHSSMLSLFFPPFLEWIWGFAYVIDFQSHLPDCVVCEMDFVIPLSRVCFHGFWSFVYVSFNVSCSCKHPSSYTCVFTRWDLFQWVSS